MADNTGHGLLATGNKKSRRKTSPCILTGTQYGKQPRGLRRGSAAARFLGMRVRLSPEEWIVVSSESRVLSGTGLCDWPITRPEESYRVWCVRV